MRAPDDVRRASGREPRRAHDAAWLAVVTLGYLALFVLLTFPAIRDFSTRFFCDGGDGLQNVWNMWWVDRAVRSGVNPWFTRYLHHPFGITLVAHTLNPFNGFAGIPLRALFGPVRAHNAIVVFSFVAGGVTAYALALRITGRRAAAFLAGCIFTFSNYHFMHAQGHLQLVALEWIPLFLLAWDSLLERPSVAKGVGAAAALWLVAMCDYYYCFYCVLAGALLVAYRVARNGGLRAMLRPPHLPALAAFVAATALLVGPLVWALLALARRDGLIGIHDATELSMDLLAPVVPGAHWRFAALTRFFWSREPSNIHESSVHVGVSVIALAVVALRRRRPAAGPLAPWVLVAASFAVLALGPRLHVARHALPGIPMPYTLLAWLVPPLRLSGCPVRMAVMVSLAMGIIAGEGFSRLLEGSRGARSFALAALALLVVEYLPAPIPREPSEVSGFVTALRAAPRDGALFDVEGKLGPSAPLYYQTIHELPMVSGYVSRLPRSVARREAALFALAKDSRWKDLCERYGIRYLLLAEAVPIAGDLAGEPPWLWRDGLKIYDAGRRWHCAVTVEGGDPAYARSP